MSRGEENTGGLERPSALADAFESLLGAIFLDGGFAAAEAFVLREFAGVRGENLLRGFLQIADAGVVAEAFPEFVDFFRRRGGERGDVG